MNEARARLKHLRSRRRQPRISNDAVLGIGLIAASALGLFTLPLWWQMLTLGGF